MRTGTIRCDIAASVPVGFFSGAMLPLLRVLVASSETVGTHPQRTRLIRYCAGFAGCCSEDRFDFCKSVDLQGWSLPCQLLNLIILLKLSVSFLMTLPLLGFAVLARFCAPKLCLQGPCLKAVCSFTGSKFCEVVSASELALEQGRKPGCKVCIGESKESNKEMVR
jgi:hypothetical protein